MAAPFSYAGLLMLMLASKTHAMVCLMGQELDPNAPHRYRWVIPVEDPCKCTEIRPGGLTNRTPNRHFRVIYFDKPLRSQQDIHQALTCPAGPGVKPFLVQGATAPSTTAGAPTTISDALTTFRLTCGVHETRYAPDPDDCAKYYSCINGYMRHEVCPDGTYFDLSANKCDNRNEVDCEGRI